jgi:diguanylate cyclase (GGDEF)-like protein
LRMAFFMLISKSRFTIKKGLAMTTDNNGSILIVDDNPQNLKILGEMLYTKGYHLIAATNGTKALKSIEKSKPDLILLDIMMPDIDGIEVCRQLKTDESTKNIPIIFITALSGIDDKLNAFNAGGMDYITKPFIEEEVIARVTVHLALKKALCTLKLLTTTDSMTGVFNRRFAYEILTKQIAIAKRENSSFVLCYVDIDNLKKINDLHGHSAGDTLINTIADALKQTVRSSDYIFRMGGDEFLLLFPDADMRASEALIKRLRNTLNQQKIYDTLIDFSFGFSEYYGSDNISVETLIKIADDEMYDSKIEKKSHLTN